MTLIPTGQHAQAKTAHHPGGYMPHHGHANASVTTAFTLPGFRIVKNVGVVRGIIVRSRSVVGNFAASIQSLFGGNITIYSQLCERAREDAFNQMVMHASELGANAIIGARYDATEVMAGITEVLAYGTAVIVEPETAGS